MSALGGRLGAYRKAFGGEMTLDAAIRRNIFREEAAPETGVAHVEKEMRAHAASLAELKTEALLSGRAPW